MVNSICNHKTQLRFHDLVSSLVIDILLAGSYNVSFIGFWKSTLVTYYIFVSGDIVSYMKSREYWGNMAVKAKNVDNSEISTTGSQTSGNKNNVFRGAPMTEKSKHL